MVYFVGAGPGAEDLITVRGMRLLGKADVIIYAGSLVNPKILDYAGESCEIYNSAKMTLDEIVEVIIGAERKGKNTVRLHTGEPSVFGAVREQMDELDRLGVKYESCPGVTACFGAAASLNMEYTLPGVSQSLIITRMEGRTDVPESESIESFAAHHASMAIYLSAGMTGKLAERLISGGYGADTPAAIVYKATWEDENSQICTVGTLEETAKRYGIDKTAVILVGDAVKHGNYRKSKLYSPDFETGHRKAKNSGDDRKSPEINVISFTKRGAELSKKIKEIFGESVSLYTKCSSVKDIKYAEYVEESLSEWTEERMKRGEALVFIGACGIAVRAISPFIESKLTDSPAVVIDESGKFAVPLLSGHIGGANALAKKLAYSLGAQPVITTATDINGAFAVDMFAESNGLYIENKDGIAKVTSKILSGQTVKMYIETGHSDKNIMLPKNIELDENAEIYVGEGRKEEAVLRLRPKNLIVGIGCKKGKTQEELENFIIEILNGRKMDIHRVSAFATIDIKKDEEGLKKLSSKFRIPLLTFSAGELSGISGDFSSSEFVRKTVGVDNICERAALLACGHKGELAVKKCARDGMTVAVAKKEWRVDFYE